MTVLPPKPPVREDRVSLWKYVRLFRKDILSAQPQRLYGAWMAEFRTLFFRSYLVNQPDLVDLVLKQRPMDFPKSGRVSEGLRPLLGNSVFLTNGDQWLKQRRIIDPAFEGGRLRETFPSMTAAAEAAAERMIEGEVEIEELASHAAADVIFRTLFSIPIEHDTARAVFHAFRDYQQSQPILNLAAFLPLPKWMPRFIPAKARAQARVIRGLIADLVTARQVEIDAGTAPDDLATKIMTTRDPETGDLFSPDEMVDQVAIFFLAGHETSASALGWALYLAALFPKWQDRICEESGWVEFDDFTQVAGLKISRDVFRETLRLYPPVPMMVREASCPEHFRNRDIGKGSQIVLSPWHLHRHTRLWERPDEFDPSRWQTENGKTCQREAFIPFSVGKRVCIGAGFAMIEGPLLLSRLIADFRFEPVHGKTPEPAAHLTVRSRNGIHLKVSRR